MIAYQAVPHQQQIDDTDFPTVVTNEHGFTDIDDVVAWLTSNVDELESKIKQSGALLLRGFPITCAEDFDRLTQAMGYPNFTYQESLSNAVRINYTDRVFTANEAPKHVEINLHNEMAQTPIYPERIMFFCQQAAEVGGASPLVRCDLLYQELYKADPKLADDFERKGVKYTTVMPGVNEESSAQGRSWRDTLNVTTVEEGEEKLERLGYSWTWQDDGSLKAVTKALPVVMTLDDGRKVFFNQLVAAFMGWKGVRDTPSKALCFGDDSPIPKEGLKKVAALAEANTFDQQWQDGDVAFVNNYLAMHGRRPYDGERKRIVLVSLGGAKEVA